MKEKTNIKTVKIKQLPIKILFSVWSEFLLIPHFIIVRYLFSFLNNNLLVIKYT